MTLQSRSLVPIAALATFLANCDAPEKPAQEVLSQGERTTEESLTQEATAVAGSSYQEARALLYDGPNRYVLLDVTERLETIIADDPDFAEARLDLAYAYARRSKPDAAAEHIAALEDMRDELSAEQRQWLDALSAWAADAPYETVQAYKALTQSAPGDRWAWYQLASAYSTIGDYDAASDASAKASALEPDPAKWEASWLYYMHAKAQYRSGDYQAAIKTANIGKNNATTWRSTFFRRALAQVKAGEAQPGPLVEEYIEISNAEGRNNPPYTNANIALFYFELQDYENAADYARKAWEAEQTSYFYWTLLYSLTEKGDLEAATALMEEVDGAYANNASSLGAEGWLAYRKRNLDMAKEKLEAAQALGRWDLQLAKNLEAVNAALEDEATAPAPPIPWLG